MGVAVGLEARVATGSLTADSGSPPCSRQSHLWEQKAGGASPEEPLAPDVSTPSPPLPPEPGGGGEVKTMGLEESQAAPKEEPGPRRRINLRGVMRSISLLEPSSEPESASGATDLPEVRLGAGREPRLRPSEGAKVGAGRGEEGERPGLGLGFPWGALCTPPTGRLCLVPSKQPRRPRGASEHVVLLGSRRAGLGPGAAAAASGPSQSRAGVCGRSRPDERLRKGSAARPPSAGREPDNNG